MERDAAALEADIARLGAESLALNADMDRLRDEIAAFEARVQTLEVRLEALVYECAAGGNASQTSGLTFLHADHLGRPVIGTDDAGDIVWDGGITTPLGQSVSTMGAFTPLIPR